MTCYTMIVHASGEGWVWTVRRCGVIVDSGWGDTREEAARDGAAERDWLRQCETSCTRFPRFQFLDESTNY